MGADAGLARVQCGHVLSPCPHPSSASWSHDQSSTIPECTLSNRERVQPEGETEAALLLAHVGARTGYLGEPEATGLVLGGGLCGPGEKDRCEVP